MTKARKPPPTKPRDYIPDWVHGSRNGYVNYGCRCAECVRANSDYKLAMYHRQRDAARLAQQLVAKKRQTRDG